MFLNSIIDSEAPLSPHIFEIVSVLSKVLEAPIVNHVLYAGVI